MVSSAHVCLGTDSAHAYLSRYLNRQSLRTTITYFIGICIPIVSYVKKEILYRFKSKISHYASQSSITLWKKCRETSILIDRPRQGLINEIPIISQ